MTSEPPRFIPGLELSPAFLAEVVKPILAAEWDPVDQGPVMITGARRGRAPPPTVRS